MGTWLKFTYIVLGIIRILWTSLFSREGQNFKNRRVVIQVHFCFHSCCSRQGFFFNWKYYSVWWRDSRLLHPWQRCTSKVTLDAIGNLEEICSSVKAFAVMTEVGEMEVITITAGLTTNPFCSSLHFIMYISAPNCQITVRLIFGKEWARGIFKILETPSGHCMPYHDHGWPLKASNWGLKFLEEAGSHCLY